MNRVYTESICANLFAQKICPKDLLLQIRAMIYDKQIFN